MIIMIMRERVVMLWILLLIVVALITAACFSTRRDKATSESADVSRYVPKQQNDTVILVKGWNEAEIRKIVQDFTDTYRQDSYPAFKIDLNKQDESLYQLTFPQDIHPTLFIFLVNYLAYPFDFDLTQRSIVVVGRTTLDPAFNGIDSSLFGQQAIFYLPDNDQDHDVVFMRTDTGATFVNSFTNLVWHETANPRLSKEARELSEKLSS